MSEELKAVKDEFLRLAKGFEEYRDKMTDEVKSIGVTLPETKATIDRMNARMDELEAKWKAPASAPVNAEEQAGAETKAFAKYCRQGDGRFSPDEQKALSASDDTAGGYLVPKQVMNSIIARVQEFSPIRQIAMVQPITTSTLEWPSDTGDFSGGWTAEAGTRTETTGQTLGKHVITAHEMYAYPKITNQLLEDSAFNLEAFLADKAGLRLAILEGTAFVNGTNVGQPEGFMVNGSVSYTPGTDASALKAAGLINLQHAIKADYARNGTWVMNRKTLGLVRGLEITSGAGYVWQPDYTGSNPPRILGQPYVEATDMPDVTTNTYPIAYGDFRRAYVIADRVQLSVLRDPYSSKTTGVVEFMFRKRVGGLVIQAEAIRKLKIATS